MAILTETPARGESLSPSLDANLNRITISLIMLLGAALRLWRLGELGLSYDEAATALMARATPSEIIVFHWTAGFEHPPLWQLLVHGWSLVAGQNEFALRYLPALAGILVIPLSLAVRTSPLSTIIFNLARQRIAGSHGAGADLLQPGRAHVRHRAGAGARRHDRVDAAGTTANVGQAFFCWPCSM